MLQRKTRKVRKNWWITWRTGNLTSHDPTFVFIYTPLFITLELIFLYQGKGFSVLAFPISDFHQELGSNEEILSFVQENFPKVNFPLFSLSSLDESPVYQNIRKQKPGNPVKWNFYKFLVDWNGQVVHTYDLKVSPMQIADKIGDLLDEASKVGGHKLVTS